MELHETRSFLISGIATLLCLCFSLSVKAGERYTDNSVLSKGNWVKIQIEQDGIYKLTYSELKKMGFDDPRKLLSMDMVAGLWKKISQTLCG